MVDTKSNGTVDWLRLAKDGIMLGGIIWAISSANTEFRFLKEQVAAMEENEKQMAMKHEVDDVQDRLDKKIQLINENTEAIEELRVWLAAQYGIVIP